MQVTSRSAKRSGVGDNFLQPQTQPRGVQRKKDSHRRCSRGHWRRCGGSSRLVIKLSKCLTITYIITYFSTNQEVLQ